MDVDARGMEGLILTLLVAKMYRAANTGLRADEETLEQARTLLRSALNGFPEKLKEFGIEEDLQNSKDDVAALRGVIREAVKKLKLINRVKNGPVDRAIEALLNEAKYDPLSSDYVGHNEAKRLGKARCICRTGISEHPSCPFHGR